MLREIPTLVKSPVSVANELPKIAKTWKTIEDRRKFLDKVAIELKIKKASDWGKVSSKQFIEVGGGGLLLNYYNGSVFDCLKSVCTEIKWKREWFEQHPRTYWQSMEHQKKFLDDFATKYGIKEPKQWGQITHSQIKQEKGQSLLNLHENSLFVALSNIYPEINWKIEWFPNFDKFPIGYWNKQNQRQFLIDFGRKNGIKKPSDWGKVLNRHVAEQGGSWIYRNYGALKKALITLLPEIPWKDQWFVFAHKNPSGYWRNKVNQQKFIEELAKKFNIQSHEMWGKITNRQVVAAGGASIIAIHGSLYKVLTDLFPNVKWNKEWFPAIPKYSTSYWVSESNQRKFLDEISSQFGIVKPSDWTRITLSLVKGQGGQGLLSRHNNSLLQALNSLYPDSNWRPSLNASLSLPHSQVKHHVHVLFPNQ